MDRSELQSRFGSLGHEALNIGYGEHDFHRRATFLRFASLMKSDQTISCIIAEHPPAYERAWERGISEVFLIEGSDFGDIPHVQDN
jgi:hypothetical protein